MDCKKSSAIIIDQIISVLDKLDDLSYSKPLEIFNGSSLGQHFRHIIDFYKCLLKGAENDILDYSSRERDVMLEQCAGHAAMAFRRLYEDIQYLCESDKIKILTDFSTDEVMDRPVVSSTVGRELMYAYDHAIHHLAIIKIGIKSEFPEISLNKNIGVAPSTIKHMSGNPKTG